MRPRANPEHFKDLDLVLTLAEASRRYFVAEQSLSYAIDAGNIAAVRCGRNVLVSRRSLDAYFSRRLKTGLTT